MNWIEHIMSFIGMYYWLLLYAVLMGVLCYAAMRSLPENGCLGWIAMVILVLTEFYSIVRIVVNPERRGLAIAMLVLSTLAILTVIAEIILERRHK
ncbi:MAG: hypothetical protein IJ719_14155 [Clostridia bacterium]|nr:hypothetical protein [Clostridia bacterium]